MKGHKCADCGSPCDCGAADPNDCEFCQDCIDGSDDDYDDEEEDWDDE